ncbi:MAG: LpqN/LpqT family lipoprotein [Gordonia sp. (in: high G+C Gram-positive bacteria)]|uniref:LpqN/LpqT family lipoprotein n=1 Tax=Gordonia sp. (in: high G+C Gram-positive bacteria) TaxID=84139 RepID=UPI0039E52E76
MTADHRFLRLSKGTAVAGLVAATALLAGCSADRPVPNDTAMPVHEGCTSYDGRFATADAGNGLTVSLPQPQGWERVSDKESAATPIVLENQADATAAFTPSATVSVGQATGSLEEIRDSEERRLREQVSLDTSTGQKTEVCGFAAYTVDTDTADAPGVPAHPYLDRIVIIPDAGQTGQSTTVTLAVQTVATDGDEIDSDTATMLDKVQIAKK